MTLIFVINSIIEIYVSEEPQLFTIFFTESLILMKVTDPTLSTSMKAFKESLTMDALGLAGGDALSSVSVQEYCSPRLNTITVLPGTPQPTGPADKMLNFLIKMLIVLGLSPRGTTGPQKFWKTLLRMCLTGLILGILSFTYIITQCKP